jgi:hypothetical protein
VPVGVWTVGEWSVGESVGDAVEVSVRAVLLVGAAVIGSDAVGA